MKTKALISFAVTAKLVWAFVFAYANCLFSHAAAQLLYSYNYSDTYESQKCDYVHCYKMFCIKLTIYLTRDTITSRKLCWFRKKHLTSTSVHVLVSRRGPLSILNKHCARMTYYFQTYAHANRNRLMDVL